MKYSLGISNFLQEISQFSSVAQSCLTLVTPGTAAHQASLSITNSWSLLKLMSIELVMPSNHLILCLPLLLPSIFLRIRAFSRVSSGIRGPKYAASAYAWCWLIDKDPDAGKDWRQEENIINLILVLTICCCPCVKSSLVLLEEGVCYDQHVLLANLC